MEGKLDAIKSVIEIKSEGYFPVIKQEPNQLVEIAEIAEELPENPHSNLSLLQPVPLEHVVNNTQCTTCNKTFTKVDHLKRHQITHTGIKPYKCDQCEMAFQRRDKLKRHQLIHTGIKDHKCHLCSKEFYRSDKLKEHLLKQHNFFSVNISPLQAKPGAKPHVCQQCNKSYSKADHLKRHIVTHSEYKPYNCDRCDKSFYRLDQLKNHKLTHFKVSLFTCIHCDKSFNSTEMFQEHMLGHLDYGHFMDAAPAALNVSSNSEEIVPEINNEKPINKTYIQLDNVNKATTLTLIDLTSVTDTEETNSMEVRPFACQQCDKFFKRADHLRRHLLTHVSKDADGSDLESRIYPCTECSKSFKRPDHLKRHLKLHADNALKCEFCRSTFNTKAILEMHKLEHANEKLHYCGQCNRTFNKLKLLTNHLQTHWTVAPTNANNIH